MEEWVGTGRSWHWSSGEVWGEKSTLFGWIMVFTPCTQSPHAAKRIDPRCRGRTKSFKLWVSRRKWRALIADQSLCSDCNDMTASWTFADYFTSEYYSFTSSIWLSLDPDSFDPANPRWQARPSKLGNNRSVCRSRTQLWSSKESFGITSVKHAKINLFQILRLQQ